MPMKKEQNPSSKKKPSRKRLVCNRTATFSAFDVNSLDNLINKYISKLEDKYRSFEVVDIQFRIVVTEMAGVSYPSQQIYSSQVHYRYIAYIEGDESEDEEDE